MANTNSNDYPREIEESTAENWLAIGTIRVTETGSENTYYVDQFGIKYFCKNYPQVADIQPEWITEPLSPYDIAAVLQGGCESGAYMPAVTYYDAAQTMSKHGDDVLDYLQDMTGEMPTPPTDTSWSAMPCFYLSKAVELFCEINADLADWEDDEPIGEAA